MHRSSSTLDYNMSLRVVRRHASRIREGVINFADEHRDGFCSDDLSTYCAIASTTLAYHCWYNLGVPMNLKEGVFRDDGHDWVFEGTDEHYTYGDVNHCWNEYKGYIIDLTATQFITCPKVYVVKSDNFQYCELKDVAYGDMSKLVRHFRSWERDQAPHMRIIKKVLEYAGY